MFEKIRVTSGIPHLDELTQGGFIKGTTNLIIGPAGAGKTIFGLHFLSEGALKDESGLLIAMQEPPWAIRRDASNFSFFDHNHYVEPEKIVMLDFTPSGWELWDPDSLNIAEGSPFVIEAEGVPYDETSLPTFLHRVFYHISQVVEEKKIERIVIDPLAAFRFYDYGNDQGFLRKITTGFLANIASLNVTTLAISELPSNTGTSIFGEEYIADAIMHLDMLSVRGEMMRILRISKMRGTKHTTKTLTFKITNDGIVFLEDDEEE
ncbi:MAG: RAD55 family ATPase [Candidatus Hodarchaeales archaeon]